MFTLLFTLHLLLLTFTLLFYFTSSVANIHFTFYSYFTSSVANIHFTFYSYFTSSVANIHFTFYSYFTSPVANIFPLYNYLRSCTRVTFDIPAQPHTPPHVVLIICSDWNKNYTYSTNFTINFMKIHPAVVWLLHPYGQTDGWSVGQKELHLMGTTQGCENV
jgi:hypothetical protein